MSMPWIWSLLTLVLSFCFYTPVIVYYYLQLRVHSPQIAIKKRYPDIAVISIFLSVLHITISRPLAVISVTMVETEWCLFGNSCMIADILYKYITIVPYSITIIGVPFYIFLKYWLLFYDIKWMQASFNFEWKYLINPNFSTIDIQQIILQLNNSQTINTNNATFFNLYFSLTPITRDAD